MWRFIRGLFAILGLVFLLLLVVAGGGGWLAWRHFQAPPELPDAMVLRLDLREPLKETAQGGVGAILETKPTVSELVLAIDRAAEDPRVKGMLGTLDETEQGLAVTQELRDAVLRFRKSGKFAIAFADTFGELSPANQGYYLATAFDEIDMMPSGTLGLTGMAVQALNARSLLDKLGIVMSVTKREEFKSAFETLTDQAPTDANLIQLKSLLDDTEGQFLIGIAQGRKLDVEQARNLLAGGPYSATEAHQAGLVDQLVYADQILGLVHTRAPQTRLVDAALYASATPEPGAGEPRIALIRAEGMIVRGEDDSFGRISAGLLATAMGAAITDKNIKAIVLRVDSPGGSPVGSDTIGRQVALAVQAGKPVIVSMGNVAASGGYWISMGATRIVAQPGTLTGSIGVIAGKPVIDGLLEKAGVLATTLANEENGAFWSMSVPYTSSMQARVDALMDETYADFKAGVAAGRKLDPAAVEAVAKGRVWSGQSALAQGLVDRLGGLHEALDDARTALGLPAGAKLAITMLPAPKSPLEQARLLLRNDLGFMGSLSEAVAFGQRALATNVMPLVEVR